MKNRGNTGYLFITRKAFNIDQQILGLVRE